jgi:hypothetical protein
MVRRFSERHNSRLPESPIGVDVVEDTHDIAAEGLNPPDIVQRETGHISEYRLGREVCDIQNESRYSRVASHAL